MARTVDAAISVVLMWAHTRAKSNPMNFFTFSDYTMVLSQISDINREDPKCWTVYMSSGRGYDLDGDTLKKFKAATGL